MLRGKAIQRGDLRRVDKSHFREWKSCFALARDLLFRAAESVGVFPQLSWARRDNRGVCRRKG